MTPTKSCLSFFETFFVNHLSMSLSRISQEKMNARMSNDDKQAPWPFARSRLGKISKINFSISFKNGKTCKNTC